MAEHHPDFASERHTAEELESWLRASLAARPAPPGFATRVMAALPEERGPRIAPRGRRWRPALRLATAAALALSVLSGTLWQQHERRKAGERAREQVLLALRITAVTLNNVGQKVAHPIDNSNGDTL